MNSEPTVFQPLVVYSVLRVAQQEQEIERFLWQSMDNRRCRHKKEWQESLFSAAGFRFTSSYHRGRNSILTKYLRNTLAGSSKSFFGRFALIDGVYCVLKILNYFFVQTIIKGS